MAYEISLVAAFAALILTGYFGRQYYLWRNKITLTFMFFGILSAVRFTNLYFMIPMIMNGTDTVHLSSHRALEWIVGLVVLLLGLEMIHTNILARVENANPNIRRMTYIIPSVVMPALILLLPFINDDLVRRLALYLMMPITFGVLFYYLSIIRNNPFKAYKPEYARGSKIIIAGYLTLVFGDAIFAGILQVFEISLGLDTIALLMVAAGGVVQTTTTFSGLYTHLNSRIIIVDRNLQVEITNLTGPPELTPKSTEGLELAQKVVSNVQESILRVFERGKEEVIPYLKLDELDAERFYQIDLVPHQLDISGSPLSVLLIISDVTESLKHSEIHRQNELLNYVLEERNKAELYLDLLTHDMSNLLQGIMLGVESAQDVVKDDSETANALKLTQSQLNKATRLLQDVDSIAEVDLSAPDLKPVEIKSVIQRVAAQMQNRKIPKTLMIQFDMPNQQVYVNADELIGECISNIIDFLLENCENEIPYLEIVLKEQPDDNIARVEVRGFSGGILDYLKEHIFDWEMRSGKSSGGIGLPLAKDIVARYGGTILVRDRIPGDYSEGAVFIIRLPLAEPANTKSS